MTTHDLIARLRHTDTPYAKPDELEALTDEAADLLEQHADAIKGAAVIADAAGAEIRSLKDQVEALRRERDEAVAKLEARAGEAVAWAVTWPGDENETWHSVFINERDALHSASHHDGAQVAPLYTHPPTGDAAGKDSVDAARVDVDAVMRAALGEKYCPPAEKPNYDWLSPTSADRADLEADDATRKSGLCERIGGRLYTKTVCSPHPPAGVKDEANYDALLSRLFSGPVDIGEAYLQLKVVGYPPTPEEFSAAIASLTKTETKS